MKLTVLLAAATILLAGAAPAGAQAPAPEYTRCESVGQAAIIDVSVATCDEARAVATAVLAAPIDGAAGALRAAGWSPLRALVAPDGEGHDIVATRARGALRIRRPGSPPDLDGWSAGRELLFSRRTLVPGARPPSDAVLCTSAFLVRLASGRLGGLSASHCGGTRRDRTVQRRNAVLRRPPQPGVLLGSVVRNVARTRPLDALVLPVPQGDDRTANAVVDRGITRPPLAVAGIARPFSGRRVCFSGRTSGIDRCGTILGARRPARRAAAQRPVRRARALHVDPRAPGRQRGGRLHRAAPGWQRARDRHRRHRRRLAVADVLHAAGPGARRAERRARDGGVANAIIGSAGAPAPPPRPPRRRRGRAPAARAAARGCAGTAGRRRRGRAPRSPVPPPLRPPSRAGAAGPPPGRTPSRPTARRAPRTRRAAGATAAASPGSSNVPAASEASSGSPPVSSACAVDGAPLSTPATAAAVRTSAVHARSPIRAPRSAHQRDDARQRTALDELQRGAAAGREVRDGVGEAERAQRGDRVAAADDRRPGAPRDGLGDRPRSG